MMGPMRALTILLVVIVIIAGVGVGLSYKRWEGQPPAIHVDRDFKALGRSPALKVNVEDSGTGLKRVTIRLKQKDQEAVLADDSFAKGMEKSRTYDVGNLIAEKVKVQPGPATLTVVVTDHAFRNFLKGNQAEFTRDFEFHTRPPRLEVLDGQHYINQGGSECVVYRVSEDADVSGVQVGTHFFPGFPAGLTDKNVRFALFALQYDWPEEIP